MHKPVIYTVGHSTHPIDYFIELIEAYGVNCLVDVRSVAASRYNPQYNQKAFKKSLNEHGITYLHFAEEFGARQTKPEVIDENGKVDFEKVRRSSAFKNGIKRLKEGTAKGFVIALMCAESDPLNCHRFSMITPALQDFDVRHILKDKTIKTTAELESELLKKYERKLRKANLKQETKNRLHD